MGIEPCMKFCLVYLLLKEGEVVQIGFPAYLGKEPFSELLLSERDGTPLVRLSSASFLARDYG